VRKTEAQESCLTLGISAERCVVLDHHDLQDDPEKWWNEAVIEDVVKEYVKAWDIDLVS
jgi:hypothetical protein